MAQFNFDPSTVPPSENKYELLPAGWYVGQITETDVGPFKDGGGESLKLTIEILTEGYRGRKVWSRLNVRNERSPGNERIAQQQLRDLCAAIGIPRVSDTTQLHNKPFGLKIKVRDDKTGKYDPSNDVDRFRAAPASFAPPAAGFQPRPPATAPSAGFAPPAGTPATPAGTSTPPWAKRAA